ncbi:ribosomal protein L7/L12 [Candidatus Vidania fulgoroideae]|uniref:50S ribosomal protein L7/L12 n=1 Tax=Candidatus Vidania fulgoroideorum TaxID=881286 RepID=A0A975ADU8_9PROT|nr:ribosomal protein L7/L12 [Candidatus Vidania fulgoroideae]
MSVEEIFNNILKLNLEELCVLVKMIEGKFPIDNLPSIAPKDTSNVVNKNSRSISLLECGPNKISVIKLVKEITGLSLLASKKLVDTLPSVIKDSVDNKEFNMIESKFTSLGCKVK